MSKFSPEDNKEIVLKAFRTLFNDKDVASAKQYWSEDYIQHSAHVPGGRDGLFGLVEAAPPEMEYENQLAVAEGNYVMLHGRFKNVGQPRNWVVADVLRLENGVMMEHWDVIQNEATEEESAGGHPMFGSTFAAP